MNALDTSKHPIIKDYKILWADLGDNISQAYAGTLAVTSTMTKSGYTNIFNKTNYKINSYYLGIQRFINSKYNDPLK